MDRHHRNDIVPKTIFVFPLCRGVQQALCDNEVDGFLQQVRKPDSTKALAQTHDLELLRNGQVYDTLFPIAEIGYHCRLKRPKPDRVVPRFRAEAAPMRASRHLR